MSKQTVSEKLIEQFQSPAMKVGWAMMLGATMLGAVEVTTGREKAVVPTHAGMLFSDVRNNSQFDGDNALRREKENEAGAHSAIYTVVNRTVSRAAGKQ